MLSYGVYASRVANIPVWGGQSLVTDLGQHEEGFGKLAVKCVHFHDFRNLYYLCESGGVA